MKSTNTQFQSRGDYTILMVDKEYDYVLEASEEAGYNWNIVLTRSSDSNIGRLSNVTIWLYSTTASSIQIQITSGSYTQTTGNQISLAANGTDFIAISAASSSGGTSEIIAYLEADIPGRGLHMKLPIAFNVS